MLASSPPIPAAGAVLICKQVAGIPSYHFGTGKDLWPGWQHETGLLVGRLSPPFPGRWLNFTKHLQAQNQMQRWWNGK